MNLIQLIFFELYEKIKLKNWAGVSRATNLSYPKRNDEFYLKLESHITPILLNHGFVKVRKRRFVKKQQNDIRFYEFVLTKRRNALKVSYGKISPKDESIYLGNNSLESYGTYGKDWDNLKPKFWKYDYEFPVWKTDKRDETLIDEIKDLLIETLS